MGSFKCFFFYCMYYIDKTFTLLINKIINQLLVRFKGVGTHFISLFKDEKTLIIRAVLYL